MTRFTVGTFDGRGDIAAVDTADYEQQGLRIGIFGASGSGKGWLLGLLLEQAHADSLPIIAIDPESELWTLQEVGALVLGGPHADAPIPPGADGIRAAMEYAIETATPLVFDLGGHSKASELLREGERIMQVFYSMTGSLRTRVVFAVTEAEIFAPQQVPRQGVAPETLAAIQKRGRKRGVIPIIETQRTADIAKATISQCNVRFIGHLDEPLDYDNVKRHVADSGWTFPRMRGLHTGHFVMTPDGWEVAVGARTVTHGGATPLGGEVQLARRATPEGLAEIIERMRAASAVEEAAAEAVGVSRTSARPEVGGVLLTREDAELYRHHQERIAELETTLAAVRVDVQQADDEIGRLRGNMKLHEADSASLANLRRALIPIIGENVAAELGEATFVGGLSEQDVIGLIRQHAPAGSGAISVLPVEALRTRYLEQTAERLYETVVRLEPDEREALLFLIGQGSFQSINAVAKALSGSDSGGVRDRWGKALQALNAKGLIAVGGSGRSGRRANVEAWIRSALGPHSPTEEEVEAVKQRALSVLMTR